MPEPENPLPTDHVFVLQLQEFAHALFDMLDLPVFGREEDAADQVAAYIYLQLGAAESRRLITGTVYAYAAEAMKGELPAPMVNLNVEEHPPDPNLKVATMGGLISGTAP